MSKRSITIGVEDRAHAKLQADASARGMSLTGFAQVLFNAAYAARHGETGDHTLDAKVSAAVILHANGMDAEQIGRALNCSEETAEKIIAAWKRELA